jgi:hypothetical protein
VSLQCTREQPQWYVTATPPATSSARRHRQSVPRHPQPACSAPFLACRSLPLCTCPCVTSSVTPSLPVRGNPTLCSAAGGHDRACLALTTAAGSAWRPRVQASALQQSCSVPSSCLLRPPPSLLRSTVDTPWSLSLPHASATALPPLCSPAPGAPTEVMYLFVGSRRSWLFISTSKH